ncbi:type IV pilus assembly protein PilB [Thermotomaculum hydrothermale]|uniref:Type IV pilus assembly protein PilB n=1 Tax=Thermotomaculum hydrothermale TaxID=981385 RepID=A0A7R6SZX2_9BACT|nr:type IV-A pilus assembly ATPase PilB [Thermotomaculum hydrothermale]BBB33167.1 type IV pilus assembly protein PilB [Thermotomaculum hydrothermale]
MAKKLGDLLVEAGLITKEQLQEALEIQKKDNERLGTILVKLGYLTEEEITSFLSKQYGIPAVNLEHFEISEDVIKRIPSDIARKYMLIPITRTGSTLTVAMADPTNIYALDDIKFLTGLNVEPVVASELSIKKAIDKYYGSETQIELRKVVEDLEGDLGEDTDLEVVEDEEEIDLDSLVASVEEAPVVKFVNMMLVDAVKKGASDVHVEPYEKYYRVRFRIDGILHEVMKPPLSMKDAITSRIKIMSKLDIAEKRLPQDGRIKLKMKIEGKKKELDFRVSVLPTLFGEKIVMRILDPEKLMLDMTRLGFEQESLDKFTEAIRKPYGMVLVTGPTGSGKTNTLYSAISQLNTPETNIMTAEDPVEFNLPGINQVNVRDEIGLTFASALRSFLRQDPNIILVGEIRDFETAEIAIKAALTGHLVLSTLHTNDAPSTISRLMNMGIEPFLVATSVNLICAQRLVRRVCKNCKEEVKVPKKTLLDIGFKEEELKDLKIYKGKGCDVCNGSGYKGRVGLYEVMEVTDAIKDLILSGATALDLREQAIKEGMITLRRSGLIKIKAGITSIEEVLRETVL